MEKKPKIKPHFSTRLKVEKISACEWKVLEDFTFESRVFGGLITVPAGFVTDFASVPRLLLTYTLFGNIAQEAAVIHDLLYQKHLCSKARADRVFLEAMKHLNTLPDMARIPVWRRYPMYLGVMIFGWTAYASGVERYRCLNEKKMS